MKKLIIYTILANILIAAFSGAIYYYGVGTLLSTLTSHLLEVL